VGEASSAMKYLKEKKLDEVIVDLKQPVLGICLGMQLMCNILRRRKYECLGIFDNKIKLFERRCQSPTNWLEQLFMI
jgi:glutamine amidotransferase